MQSRRKINLFHVRGMLSRKLNVAVLQLNPRIGQVSANIERANRILRNHGFLNETGQPNRRPLDLLILPELAFTGYNFKSRDHITPYLEPTSSGVSSKWAMDISKSLNCHTLVGYPELCSKSNNIYNSAAMFSPSGKVLFNYRKSFLYSADVDWGCSESPDGFQSYTPEFESVALKGLKVQVGICMDLNPYKFEAPFEKFEFANSALENDVSLILCPMAWLNSESPSLQTSDEAKQLKKKQLEHEMDPLEPDVSTLNYWFVRMNPFIKSPPKRKIAFVTCNRSGWEDDILYAGSSQISVFDPALASKNYISFYSTLGQLEEDLIYQEIDVEPQPGSDSPVS
ncbi:Nta1p [Sugiyamaella lignohabitans]|uniref:Nta1p n=1 Tax=Sugiyamaella lignohabitans TaxID=796027 RepID=A0A167EQ98_9ASCO|nr:Nta1p [Sugiyamaella lignohabitans]ANB14338.1 Nta1p [Sugiyamaella lignohabitans]